MILRSFSEIGLSNPETTVAKTYLQSKSVRAKDVRGTAQRECAALV